MKSERKLSSDVHYDILHDCINVVVRITWKENGRIYKKGALFSFTEELLCNTPEGQAYVKRTPDRFELIVLEEKENKKEKC